MADAAEVGGKAASLGELIAAGVRVPDGVVMTAESAARAPHGAVAGTPPPVRGISGQARSPSARAGSPRTAPSARSPACTSRCSTCPPTDLAAAVDRCLASAPRRPRRRVRAGGRRPHGGDRPAHGRSRSRPASPSPPIRSTATDSTCVVTAVRGLGERLVSGAAAGDEWVVRRRRRPRARRQPEQAIDATQAARGRTRGAPHRRDARDAAGHRVGDRRARARSGSSRPGR